MNGRDQQLDSHTEEAKNDEFAPISHQCQLTGVDQADHGAGRRYTDREANEEGHQLKILDRHDLLAEADQRKGEEQDQGEHKIHSLASVVVSHWYDQEGREYD